MYKSDDKMMKYFCSSTKSLWVKRKKEKKKKKENAIKSLFKILKTKVTGDYHNKPSENYHMQ